MCFRVVVVVVDVMMSFLLCCLCCYVDLVWKLVCIVLGL